ncbi:MAG: bifunctional riboflavin kinase/FAD synthetase [Alphaproteobacteria bacterium]|jgi:riboflavin kinase/FMN adenylyltransferase|nr:bifunctional riboflavin kinase/FAD synthetase [Alphaproteobacteria bacterium]MDP7223544.1 bifunctional riboflavin kinase/FAD synthetase [Alphaproteobacteria bacterium]
MDIFNSLINYPSKARDTVLVIGNFDGVHRGHREIFETARKLADQNGKKLAVLTFEPHPRRLFRADDPPFRITPEHVKNRLLESCEIDHLITLDFNWDFASQSADDFIQTILKQALQPFHIMIGYDFHFGQLRKGNAQSLIDAGFDVTVIDQITADNGDVYSSSNIRTALRHGDIAKANTLLGWDWEIEGIVVQGDQRGREIGYPTANVHLDETLHPAYGIYATYVQVEGEEIWRPSATNIGIRPMFEVEIGQVESYIFDFDRDIYGKSLRIKPVQRLRGEAKFDSLEALITQIEQDCDQARKILA